MLKKIFFGLLVSLITTTPVFAGSIAEEHEKAEKGGYLKEYETAMEKNQGWRTKEEHDNYHKEQEQKANNTEKVDDYGKKYLENQLGTDGKVRTW